MAPAYRTVFNLFAIDGYSHEEISELLNISVGTSKSNLFKARQKLQERLSSAGGTRSGDVYFNNFSTQNEVPLQNKIAVDGKR
ncbi:RNA polymerase sigma factor [Pedobacter panaciterrae]